MLARSPIDPTRLSDETDRAIQQLAKGIAVVTAGSPAFRTGLIATSIVVLSRKVPAVLVCLNESSSAIPVLRAEGRFGISLLASHHELVADRFGATGLSGNERFEGASWHTLVTGAPVLADALSVLDCEVEEITYRFSQALVVARVVAAEARPGTSALIAWRGRYEQLGWSDLEASLAVGL